MAYYIDLEKITIEDYKEILKSATLIPSWRILREDIDKNLDTIKAQGVNNLAGLQKALKDKKRVEEFALQSGLSEDYMNILRRVINGYQPKPNRIKDFPGISETIVIKLEAIGIKNTLHLYDKIITIKQREQLSAQTGISKEDIIKLAKLTDLSRVKWVNHTFANVLLLAGYDTAQKVAKADYQQMYEAVRKLNQEKQLFKGHIGANDMKFCVEAARDLDFEIEIGYQ